MKKIIWIFWDQGFASAPPVVRLCLESWIERNPDWIVIPLDRNNFSDHITLPHEVVPGRQGFPVQKLAAVLRLLLLKAHGGVWVDATVFCHRPLDQWLNDHAAKGFFAFRSPGEDRLMSNWFIAADKDDPILAALHDAFVPLWLGSSFRNQGRPFGKWVLATLQPVLRRHPALTLFWTTALARRILGVYPYFIFHYTFNRVILTRRHCRRLWQAGGKLSAMPPHQLQFLQFDPAGVRLAQEHIAAAHSVVSKLDWRLDAGTPYWGAVLDALRSSLSSRELP